MFQSTMCEAISVDCSSCNACEDVAENLYQCIADTFGCSSFQCTTSLPTTAPTPVAVSPICATELENARTCIDQQNVFQRSCTECTSWVEHCARRDARFLSLLTSLFSSISQPRSRNCVRLNRPKFRETRLQHLHELAVPGNSDGLHYV